MTGACRLLWPPLVVIDASCEAPWALSLVDDAKNMQIECRILSLLKYFAEMQLFFFKENANERNESLLSNCRVLLFCCKDTTKNWEWGQNDEKSMRMSGLIDLGGFSVKTMDATKKSVEARVALLSRYSFRWRRGPKSPWGNGCKLSEYSD